MRQRDIRAYLHDILDAAHLLEEFGAGQSLDDYVRDADYALRWSVSSRSSARLSVKCCGFGPSSKRVSPEVAASSRFGIA